MVVTHTFCSFQMLLSDIDNIGIEISPAVSIVAGYRPAALLQY